MMCCKSKTCCFTGHRKMNDADILKIIGILEDEIVKLIKDGYQYFGSGGAIGFDTIAAETILKLKNNYPHIKLILVLPCERQTRFWNSRDKMRYDTIKSRSDKVVYISREYNPECMYKRNRHLVDYSSMCICYLKESKGGTAYTVHYARKNGLQIRNIANLV